MARVSRSASQDVTRTRSKTQAVLVSPRRTEGRDVHRSLRPLVPVTTRRDRRQHTSLTAGCQGHHGCSRIAGSPSPRPALPVFAEVRRPGGGVRAEVTSGHASRWHGHLGSSVILHGTWHHASGKVTPDEPYAPCPQPANH
ncbi:hypothetical protein AAFF_G00098410 [Aldrovandia affinis]|uniref:Uncharacterized protein n=1 Tax=Aldrovandia affinis TaxID=143900 RepID=A0AAD7RXR4_9TELE|nr:hypothetical protein AAFF_G00098410 [Aldrovandia affinis]